MKKGQLSLIFIFISTSIFAQYNIQGRVIDDENKEAFEVAAVRLLNAKDSSLVTGTQTNREGRFSLTDIKPGRYIVNISFLGYQDNNQPLNISNKNITLPDIRLKVNAQILSEMVVEGTAAQMIVKGDTVEFNASAFKTAENAVVEELLKKLPGVEISKEGEITVNGEKISKIRIDGEKFFDGDIEMATKNIPADMIEKVQVLEKKSEMAELTGFEDDETERIINLTIKPNRKKGTFGNITAGGGMDIDKNFRYDANAFLNLMRNNSQTAFTGGANNINTARSTRGRGSWGGGSGITETQNLGINNNTIFNKDLKFGGDGSFNHSDNESTTLTEKESYSRGSVFNENSKSQSNNENYSVNGRVELEWTIDTLNKIIFQPNVNYNESYKDSRRDYENLTDSVMTSFGSSENHGKTNTVSAGLNTIYNRKFASKAGRTLTMNLKADMSSSDAESFNDSRKYSILNGITDTTIVDQRTDNNSNKYNVNMRVSFVEPLWNNKNFMEGIVAFSHTRNTSEKLQYDKDATGDYTVVDTTYSNDFKNLFFSETFELNYRYVEKNYNVMIGLQGQPSQTNSYTTYGSGRKHDITNNVFNFAPRARFQYKLDKRKFFRIDYRGKTNQPSVSQMQPVRNNSNLMNETVGNPSLNPAFNHRFDVRYSMSDGEKMSSFSFNINGNFTKDALVTNSIYDATGKQYTQTVNADKMPYSIYGGIMYNTPFYQKKFHFNTFTNVGYNTRHGYSRKGVGGSIDVDNLPLGDLSTTKRFNAGESLSLRFVNDWLEAGIRGSVNYSNTRNNLNDNNNNETWDWSGTGNVVFRLPKDINIASDISYVTRTGYSNFDQDELIWNASIDASVFKKKGVITLKVYDILQQQLNIRQTIGDNYIQYTESNMLRSYFMLSFTYKINKFSGGASQQDMQMRSPGGRRPMMPMM